MSKPEDDEIFDQFIRSEQDRLMGFAMSLCKDRDSAEDLVQDAITRLWQDWEEICNRAAELSRQNLAMDSSHSVGPYIHAWLLRTIKNQFLDEEKKARKKDVPFDALNEQGGLLSYDPGPLSRSLDLASLYKSFLEKLGEQGTQEARFLTRCAHLVRLAGYTYEEAIHQLQEQDSYLLEGYSSSAAARRSRATAAVSKVDQLFIAWLYGTPSD